MITVFRKALSSAFDFIRIPFRKFLIDECPGRSASTTYTTIFSLVPLTTVFFSIFTYFEIFEKMKDRIQHYLLTQLLPDSSLTRTVGMHLNEFELNAKAAGIFGLVAFIATTIILISQVETHLNAIWGTRKKRSLIKRILIYYPSITIMPFVIAGPLYFTTNLRSIFINTFSFAPFFSLALSFVAPYLITTLALTLIYKYLPNTRVEWISALVSGVTCALLWENSKFVFTWYVSGVVNYSKIYGSLSVIPVFLLYLFLSWAIVYFAAEVGAIVQNYRGGQAKSHFRVVSFADYLSVLHLVYNTYFNDSRPIQLSEISEILAIPDETAIKITDHLTATGFLEEVRKHRFSPGLPVNKIDITPVWEEFVRLNPGTSYLSRNKNLANYLEDLRRRSLSMLAGDNFRDLMRPL